MPDRTFEILHKIGDKGRLLWKQHFSSQKVPTSQLFRKLPELRGEASAIVIADELIARLSSMSDRELTETCKFLLDEMSPRPIDLKVACKTYLLDPSAKNAHSLSYASRSPRSICFEMLATSKKGPQALLLFRTKTLALRENYPELKIIDQELLRLFQSWFNRGFLEIKRINWQTPAHILEKLISYEAVHEITGWHDLRRRLDDDKGCYAFFHPSLKDDPLIFVQVALRETISDNIKEILFEPTKQFNSHPKAAVFYSISNCQSGLKGVSFGNFLIKNVVKELSRDFPTIKSFATLSPIPGFAQWLQSTDLTHAHSKDELKQLCAHYLLREKKDTLPHDPVARFHLRNGASLERINADADPSIRGQKQSLGFMVNYVYDLNTLELNHEKFINSGEVTASNAVVKLAKSANL